jgi:hypothetical protein
VTEVLTGAFAEGAPGQTIDLPKGKVRVSLRQKGEKNPRTLVDIIAVHGRTPVSVGGSFYVSDLPAELKPAVRDLIAQQEAAAKAAAEAAEAAKARQPAAQAGGGKAGKKSRAA